MALKAEQDRGAPNAPSRWGPASTNLGRWAMEVRRGNRVPFLVPNSCDAVEVGACFPVRVNHQPPL